jgi:hypothetical protein
MIELNGQAGEVRMTIEVKRAETGKVETFELVGALDEEQLKALQAQKDD